MPDRFPTAFRTPTAAGLALLISAAGLATSQATAGTGGGGIGAPKPPKPKSAVCTERCLGIDKPTVGGKVEIGGRSLENVGFVRFRKQGGGSVKAEPLATRPDLVRVKVPPKARSGKPVVGDSFGSNALVPDRLTVKPASAIEDAGPFKLAQAETGPGRAFVFGSKPMRLDYLFKAKKRTDVRIDVVKRAGGKVVRSFTRREEQPFATHSLRWDGTKADGKAVPDGRYKFLVGPLSGSGDDGNGATKFRLYNHIFPLRGKHTYGDGLGAGRNHQGQDVFAKCGTSVVAARGGKVVTSKYQSAAGYYVVIRGRGTGMFYSYLHLAPRGRIKRGATVRTGQRIGFASDTGRATGCHLHFELWTPPGPYVGGRVLDPTRPLKAWDRYS